jgi:hypothetical protein
VPARIHNHRQLQRLLGGRSEALESPPTVRQTRSIHEHTPDANTTREVEDWVHGEADAVLNHVGSRASLAAAIALILEDRWDDGNRGVPPDAERETVTAR